MKSTDELREIYYKQLHTLQDRVYTLLPEEEKGDHDKVLELFNLIGTGDLDRHVKTWQ